jgi:hypothetical protein
MGINSLFGKYVRMPTGYAVALTAAAFIAACGGSNEASSTRIPEPTRAATAVVSPPPDPIENTFTPVPSFSPSPETNLEATVEVTVPTYTPAPSPTSTPTPEPTVVPTPEPTQEPTATPTPTPVPTPSIMEVRDGLFADYQGDKDLADGLAVLQDYNNPSLENISNLETLSKHLSDSGNASLAREAVLSALEWSRQDKPLQLDSVAVVESIDYLVEHKNKYGISFPGGNDAESNIMLFQLGLNAGEVTLEDGTVVNGRNYLFSDPATVQEKIETLIAEADIWNWMAMPETPKISTSTRELPEGTLVAEPDWIDACYANNPWPVILRQIAFGGPFSTNASARIDLSRSPLDCNDSGPVSDTVQQQLYDMIDFQPNETAWDLHNLAEGNFQETTLRHSVSEEFQDAALRKMYSGVKYKSGFIMDLDVRSRAFIEYTGNLNVSMVEGHFDKDEFLRSIELSGGSGAFRLSGERDTINNRDFPTLPKNGDIILYATGVTFRRNDTLNESHNFNTEYFGFMLTNEDGKDPRGNFNPDGGIGEAYSYGTFLDGRLHAVGEPWLWPNTQFKYPFFDEDKNNEWWLTSPKGGTSIGETYGANFILNPALIGDGFSYLAENEKGRNRGPWEKAFDNRKDASPIRVAMSQLPLGNTVYTVSPATEQERQKAIYDSATNNQVNDILRRREDPLRKEDYTTINFDLMKVA